MHTDARADAPSRPRQMSDDEVEGRLTAHRDLLTKLMELIAADETKRAALFAWLGERTHVSDDQEDPGAVIMPAFAEQQSRADEFEVVAENLRRLVHRGV